MCISRELSQGERYRKGMKLVERKIARAKRWKKSEVKIPCDDVTIYVINSLKLEGYDIYFDWNRDYYIIKI